MKLFREVSIASALLATVSAAHAADVMYQCVDPQGRKTFSNVKPADKGSKCTALNLEPLNPVPAPSKPPGKNTSPSPAGFPKVGESIQKERDNDRRRILENELQAEQKNLDQARKDLAEQESIRSGDEKNDAKVLDRLEPYKNKVALHERNIEAIEKELDKLR
ncbi:MAG: DUF4124 domain-containing protein [Candidatus Accumulibacter sp.]|nr:DUF4124 domain-containing protein [Accumulibacter sp.]